MTNMLLLSKLHQTNDLLSFVFNCSFLVCVASLKALRLNEILKYNFGQWFA